jgi:hypothetical protein
VRWLLFFVATLAWAQSPAVVRRAVNRALPPLQRSAAKFVQERACFSCHHNALATFTMRMARDRGLRYDAAVLAAVEEKTIKSGGTLEDVVEARNVQDPTPNDSLLLMTQSTTDAASYMRAQRLATWQREDGHWITSDFRPPHSSSLFTTTATAVRALRDHLNWGANEAHIAKARTWLAATKPASTEDASFRVMGLVWSGAAAATIADAAKELQSRQRPDGGWSQTSEYLVSDAYSTGEAIYALHEAGVASKLGIAYLIRTQAPTGTWRVKTRMLSPAEVSPPYFETGFPYKKDQFISYAATCWATMALLTTLPAQSTQRPPAQTFTIDRNPANLPAFTRLTIAASYYGNLREVETLLNAGAPIDAPEGTRSRHSPLQYAAMSGDIAIVRLLLARGANPNAGAALSEAITFGHADVVKALIDAGADTGGVESTGVNLLHWASITNRADVIPLLAAKIPLNDIDDFGFTPLMYAATLDHNDTKTLDALLAAGADPTIRDFNERTPLAQARRFGHNALAAKLSVVVRSRSAKAAQSRPTR